MSVNFQWVVDLSRKRNVIPGSITFDKWYNTNSITVVVDMDKNNNVLDWPACFHTTAKQLHVATGEPQLLWEKTADYKNELLTEMLLLK